MSCHIGSIETLVAAFATRGMPVYGLADDTAYPELYELLQAQRRRWGVEVVPWRNLRSLFRILREPVVLGLLVDWGYRAEDVPVRLFGAWTTLPAGPAVLAARTGALLVPVACRRLPDGRYEASTWTRSRSPTARPAGVARATQAIADAVETMVVDAPAQWYTFKRMWPATAAEAEALAARAAAGRQGAGRGSPSRAQTGMSDPPSGTPRQRLTARLVAAAARPRLPPAGRPPGTPASTRSAAAHYLLARAAARPRAGQHAAGLRRARGRGPATPTRRRGDERPTRPRRLVASVFRHHARYLVELMRGPTMTAGLAGEPPRARDDGHVDAAYARVAAGGALLVLGLHFGRRRDARHLQRGAQRRRVAGPMETIANPPLQAWFTAQRERLGVQAVTPRPRRPPAELRRALREGGLVGIVADRDITGSGRPTQLFGAPAPLPAGPALLALESRRAHVRVASGGGRAGAATRADGPARLPAGGSLRERVESLHGRRGARLRAPRGRGARSSGGRSCSPSGRTSRPRGGCARRDGRGTTERRGRADLHIHTRRL